MTGLISKIREDNRVVFFVIFFIVVALLTEASLVKNYDLTGSAPLSAFLIMIFVYTLGQYYFLNLVSSKSRGNEMNVRVNALSYKIVRYSQYTLAIILVFLFLQMLLNSHYSTVILIIVITISYALAATMLGILAQRFFSWFIGHRTFVVMLYGLSAAALAINAVITLVFINDTLSIVYDTVGPHRGVFSYVGSPGSSEDLLNSAYNVVSVVSFILTWWATSLLLYPYSKKIGTMKYWVVVSLPLIYFLSQFPSVFLNVFASLLNSDPVFYGILLSVVFTVSKASGGVLFGSAFWIMARNTPQGTVVRDYLIVAAIGFVLLFVSDQAIVLLAVPYPPLGLSSVSFVGLSSYLILTGIYSSAVYISQDSKLRQSIRTIAIRESRLLDSIGTAHMEQEIQRRVTTLLKRNQELIEQETGIGSSTSEEADMKEYLREVINEVKLQKERPKADKKYENEP
jgi:hypothetical protein